MREGDGTMTVWVTADRQKFIKHIVKTGLTHGGFAEIARRFEARRADRHRGSLFIANQFTNAATLKSAERAAPKSKRYTCSRLS